jgi:hypothetical protein
LISPDTVPQAMGFDPRPKPFLIATFPMRTGEAMAVSRGLDRDRVVDESGNQTVVFSRRGARPFHLDEMAEFLRHRTNIFDPDPNAPHDGDFYRVNDMVNLDGVLKTRSGEAVPDPLDFGQPPPPPAAPPPEPRIQQRPN